MIITTTILLLSCRWIKKERGRSPIFKGLARHEGNPWGNVLLAELSALVGAIAAISLDLLAITGVVTGSVATALLWAAADPIAMKGQFGTS